MRMESSKGIAPVWGVCFVFLMKSRFFKVRPVYFTSACLIASPTGRTPERTEGDDSRLDLGAELTSQARLGPVMAP